MPEGVRIHVMPKEFWNGKAVLPEGQKPASLPAPLPVSPLPLPPVPPASRTVVPSKPSHRGLIVAASCIVLALILTGGWYAWSLSQQEPVIVTTDPPVTTPPVTTPPAEKPIETPPVVIKPVSGKDTDSDGITDGEEKLYGTDARNPDSDADSFLDGNEVFHRYDPLGPAPQTLLDTGTVAIYTADSRAWTIYYPIKWKATVSGKSVIFQTLSTAQVTITEEAKADAAASLEDWYRATRGKDASSDIKSLLTKNGYQELLSNDKLTAYVDAGDLVYVFTYDLKEEKSIDYLTTFQMMVNSFLANK